MNTITVELDSNKGFQIRQATLEIAKKSPLIGILTVKEIDTVKGKQKISRYACVEQPQSDEGDRLFRCTKSGGDTYYHVRISKTTNSDHCDCNGHTVRESCKHSQALRRLLTKINVGV